MPSDFFALVAEAFRLIHAEQPAAFARLRALWGQDVVRLTHEGRTCSLSLDPDGLTVADQPMQHSIAIRLDRAVLDALLAGRSTLLDSVLDDTLEVTGGIDAVARHVDIVCLFFAAAMRSPRMAQLHADFRHNDNERAEGTPVLMRG